MKIEIDDKLIQEHFSEGQIKGFMQDLELNYIETVLYLWFYNYCSISSKEIDIDNGRPMYIKFAKSAGRIFKKAGKNER